MPKVAESVLVSYCDFCPETNRRSRAVGSCELCGLLVCERHMVYVGFNYEVPVGPKPTDELGEISALLSSVLVAQHASFGGRVCIECTKASLGEIVRRLIEHKTESHAKS